MSELSLRPQDVPGVRHSRGLLRTRVFPTAESWLSWRSSSLDTSERSGLPGKDKKEKRPREHLNNTFNHNRVMLPVDLDCLAIGPNREQIRQIKKIFQGAVAHDKSSFIQQHEQKMRKCYPAKPRISSMELRAVKSASGSLTSSVSDPLMLVQNRTASRSSMVLTTRAGHTLSI